MPKRKITNSTEGYNIYAPLYDSGLSRLDSFEKDELIKLVGNISNKRVLDLGCGTGRIAQTLKRRVGAAGAHFTLVDISEEMLRIAKNRLPDVDIVHADMTALPLKDDTFDIAIAAFVIVHIPTKNLPKVFDEVARVLKPGGTFILTNINQRKAPRLTLNQKEKLVIKSYYHIPKHVIKKLEDSLFKIEKEVFVNEGNTWINQIICSTISK
ncbi:MAG: class I SAM-dependent methyltransferase [Candidatus Gracilibacteria bacterium]